MAWERHLRHQFFDLYDSTGRNVNQSIRISTKTSNFRRSTGASCHSDLGAQRAPRARVYQRCPPRTGGEIALASGAGDGGTYLVFGSKRLGGNPATSWD